MWKNKRWKKTLPSLQEHQPDACYPWNIFKNTPMSSHEGCKWWWKLIKTKRMVDHMSGRGMRGDDAVRNGRIQQQVLQESLPRIQSGFEKIQEGNQILKKCSKNFKIYILQAMMIKKKTFMHQKEEEKKILKLTITK